MNHIANLISANSPMGITPPPLPNNIDRIQTAPATAPVQWHEEPTQSYYADPVPEPTAQDTMPNNHACNHDACQREIEALRKSLRQISEIVAATTQPALYQDGSPVASQLSQITPSSDEGAIEGVFDGVKMLDQHGKSYDVPPNYASKSKLVEGDMMKLTISPTGSYKFKQIGPIPRRHIKGSLMFDQVTNQWQVLADGRMYNILTASVTFYKGKPGDECTVLIPENGESSWGAVEHILHN